MNRPFRSLFSDVCLPSYEQQTGEQQTMTTLLVTNDDGINAPGILALSTALQALGNVRVSAPAKNQSASGHKKTLFQDIHYKEIQLENGVPGMAVNGSPADCIALAALGMTDWPPDIVVSGINRGENMGQDLTYSGTVTAALEGAIHGVLAVAVSLSTHDADTIEDYERAAQIAVTVVRRVLEKGLPPFTILNVNVPNVAEIKGLRITRQGVRIYLDKILRKNGGIVQIVGDPPTGNFEEEGTDVWAVHNGYVSITPVHLDMTAHRFMADLVAWDIEID